METNTEMQQLVNSVVRTIEEDTFRNLVSDGMDSPTAFEYALNTSWDLPDEVQDVNEDYIEAINAS